MTKTGNNIEATKSDAGNIVEHFFRHESGKIISHLARVFGTEHIELIEDSVQDALLKAMQVWGYGKVPDNPSGWILKVAKNKILDNLRRQSLFREKKNEYMKFEKEKEENDAVTLDTELENDQLGMMFACCHPSLTAENQIILTLKILCGFSTGEIAKALLKKEETIAKAITRAKSRMKTEKIKLEVPQGNEVRYRIKVVLNILYLLFNEGYSASHGDELVRKELCEESIFLINLLLKNKSFSMPEAHALLSLMLFQASRLDARTNARGELLTLEEQDRGKWDRDMVQLGHYHLEKSSNGVQIMEYHLQAAIASCHCTAENFEETNWERILSLYNYLMQIKATPVVAINRVVAFAKVNGAKKGLEEMDNIEGLEKLQNYYLYHAIRSELLSQAGEFKPAAEHLKKAIELTNNTSEKKYLVKKLSEIPHSTVH